MIELLRFGLVGLLNTFLGMGIIYTAKWQFLFNDYAANFIGYFICIVLGFFLNTKWTFEVVVPSGKDFISYATISFLSYMLNLAAVAICIELLNLSGDVSQLFGVAIYSAASFLMLKFMFNKE